MDRSVGNTTRPFNETLNDLLHMEEVTLLENASHAVGEQGVIGKNTPAVMPFYMFALKVTRLLDSSLTSIQNTTKLNELNHQSLTSARPKRFFSWVKGLVTLWRGCKRYKNYPNCKGLCGRKCSCWWWVCGDCCYHRACFDHDDCCERRGYNHWRCILAVDILVSCEAPYYC